ncbi:hypothetical protein EV127DRAFT_464772 [Xylaria flabelliformis]|nr:hypothetical protein EV127DRAFT_464772 [Xylaria flabelliformis]
MAQKRAEAVWRELCQSLGGCIWKQAYANMAEKMHEHTNVLDHVSGVIFLGTPHIEDANRFDLNIVENIVVSKELVTMPSNPNAVLYGIASTHENLCKVEIGGKLYNAIASMIDAPVAQYELSSTPQDVTEYDHIRSLSISHTSSHTDTKQDRKAHSGTPSASAGYSSQFSYEMIPTTNQPEPTRPKLSIPCFSVGSKTHKSPFFGRDDIIRSIDKVLLPEMVPPPVQELGGSTSNLKTFALCGAGGIGKTELASEYIFTRKNKYSAIFWVTADSRNVLFEDFARIAVDLGLQDKNEAQNLAESCELVKGWLCNPVKDLDAPHNSHDNEISWLLVFDNVDDWRVIEDFWPTTGIGSILITSRDPLLQSNMYTTLCGVDLEPFSTSDAQEFLCTVSEKDLNGTATSAKAVAEWAGGLPLIITAIASTMSSRDLTYDTMLDLLKEHGFEAVSADHKPQLHTVQTVSIASMIGLARLDEHTRDLIDTMSFLNPEGIPQQMLIDQSGSASLDALPRNYDELDNAQRKLQQSSLISFNETAKTLSMHRIYQDIVRESLSTEKKGKALSTALGIISVAWEYQPLEHRFNIERYEICEKVFPHVDRVYQHYEEMFRARKVDASAEAAALFNDAGWYWFERGFPQESKPFCKLAQSICETLKYTKPSDHVTKMLRESHNNQGSAANETNNPQESLHHNLMWLNLMRERVTPEGKEVVDYELGCVFNEVGVAYAMNDMYPLALDFFKQSMSTYQSLPDYDEKWLGWPLPNIGLVHWIQGNYKEALEALHGMRKIFEAAYGPNDTKSFKTGKVLYGIGNVYLSQGDLQRALEFHLRCYNQWSITLDGTHHRIGDVSHKIAQDLIGQGQFDKAQDYLDRALRIFARRPYHRHEHTRTLFRQGQLYLARGQGKEAEQSFKAAHKQRQSLVPHDPRSWDELLEKDYDGLVNFMAR